MKFRVVRLGTNCGDYRRILRPINHKLVTFVRLDALMSKVSRAAGWFIIGPANYLGTAAVRIPVRTGA